jgi:glycogen phosphorylase
LLVNGSINLSELDGWWAEAYTPEVGWALGGWPGTWRRSGLGRRRSVSVFEQFEREVIPEFYTRDKSGIPKAWLNRMRESMARSFAQGQ